MPVVRMPDGQLVNFPDSMPASEIRSFVERKYPGAYAPPEPAKSTFMDEVMRGLETTGSAYRTAFESLLGDKDVAAVEGIQRGQEIAEDYGIGPSFEGIRETYRTEGLPAAVKQAITEIPRAGASQSGVLASLIAGGRLGATAMPVPQLKPLAGTVGGLAAIYPQLFGPDTERQAAEQIARGEEVDVDLKKAAVAAALQTGLEAVGGAGVLGRRLLSRLLGTTPAELSRQQLINAANRSLLGSVTQRAATGVVTEMPTEIAQQVIERYQAGLPVDNDEAMSEYLEAGYLAGLVGGGIGTVRGVGERITRPQDPRLQQTVEEDAEVKSLFGDEATTEEAAPAETVAAPTKAITAVDLRDTSEAGWKKWTDQNRINIPTLFKGTGALVGLDLSDPAQNAQAIEAVKQYQKTRPKSKAKTDKLIEDIWSYGYAVQGRQAPEFPGVDKVGAKAAPTETTTVAAEPETAATVAEPETTTEAAPETDERTIYDIAAEERAKAGVETESEEIPAQRGEEQFKSMFTPEELKGSNDEDLLRYQTELPELLKTIPQQQKSLVEDAIRNVETEIQSRAPQAETQVEEETAPPVEEPVVVEEPVATEETVEEAPVAEEPVVEETVQEAPAEETEEGTGLVFAEEETVERGEAAPQFVEFENARPIDTASAEVMTAYRNTTEESPQARKLQEILNVFEPSSAIEVLVAESTPTYTEREFTASQGEARAVLDFLRPKLSDRGRSVVDRVNTDVERILENLEKYRENRIPVEEREERKAKNRSEGQKKAQKTKSISRAARETDLEIGITNLQRRKPYLSRKEAEAEYRAELKRIENEAADARGIDEPSLEELQRAKQSDVLVRDPGAAAKARAAGKTELAQALEKEDARAFADETSPEALKKQIEAFERSGKKRTQLPASGPEQTRQVVFPSKQGLRNVENLQGPQNVGRKLSDKAKTNLERGNLSAAIRDAMPNQPKDIQKLLNKLLALNLATKVVIDERGGINNREISQEEYQYVQDNVERIKTTGGILDFVINEAPDPDLRVIATAVKQRLAELNSDGLGPIEVKILHAGDPVPPSIPKIANASVRGAYSYPDLIVDNKIRAGVPTYVYLKAVDTGNPGTSFEVITHEFVHAVTSAILLQARAGIGPENYVQARNDLIKVGNAVVESIEQKRKNGQRLTPFEATLVSRRANFLDNEQEILAWGLSSKESQKLLDSIPYRQGEGTLWSVFTQAIRKLLGLSPAEDTALSELLRVSQVLLGTKAVSTATTKALLTKAPMRAVPVGSGGYYDTVNDTIVLSSENGLNEGVLIHEFAHAGLAKAVADPNSQIAKDFAKFFAQIKDSMGDAYGAQDTQEFVAEFMGNFEFRALLNRIKAPKGEKTFLGTIIDSILRFIGIRKEQTAYDAAYKHIKDLVGVTGTAEATLPDLLFFGTPQTAQEVLDDLASGRYKVDGRLKAEAEQFLKRAPDNIKQLLWKGARLEHIYDRFKLRAATDSTFAKPVEELKKLIDAEEQRMGYGEKIIDQGNKNVRAFEKLEDKYKAAVKRAGVLARDARLAKINFLLDEETRAERYKNNKDYKRLNNIFNNLPKPVRDMYLTMRKDFDAAYNTYWSTLESQLTDGKKAVIQLRKEFEKAMPVEGYVPNLRFGDYVLDINDFQGMKRVVLQFETPAIREKAVQVLGLKPNSYKVYERLSDVKYNSNTAGPLVGKLMAELPADTSQEVKDSIYQAYLTMFPAQSIVKNFMRSENIPGMSTDIIKAYATTMPKWARKLADLKYLPKVEEALTYFSNEQNSSDADISSVSRNITEKAAFLRDPHYSKLVSGATTASYAYYILGNISSATVNLSTLPIFTLPQLGGQFGFTEASAELLKAGKFAPLLRDDNWGQGTKYNKLYNQLVDQGQLGHTVAREILGMARTDTTGLKKYWDKAWTALSYPFAKTEQYNRAVTAIAAYELARKGNASLGQKPMGEQDAIDFALNVVKRINTSGTPATGAAIMQGDLGRIFWTFKSFILNSAYVLGTNFADAVKGETPEIRRIARRQLAGTYAISGSLLGVAGLPFYGAFNAMLSLLHALTGDDDEYYNPREEALLFFGELGYKGPLNYFTGLEIQSRVSLANDILWRDDPRGMTENGLLTTALMGAAGPIGSIATGYDRAMSELKKGNVYRAVEYVSPGFMRNPLRAWRYLQDGGVMTLRGDDVTTDLNAFQIAMKGFGFTSTEEAMTYEKRGYVGARDDFYNGLKSMYLEAIFQARRMGDSAKESELKAKLLALNEKVPGIVKPDTVERSIRAKTANMKNSIAGLNVTDVGKREYIRLYDGDL